MSADSGVDRDFEIREMAGDIYETLLHGGIDKYATEGIVRAVIDKFCKATTTAQAVPTIDLWHEAIKRMQKAVAESDWIPKEYFMGDWVSDCCEFLRHRESQHPQTVPTAWHDIEDDTLSRLLNGCATPGDQMIAAHTINEAQIFAGLYYEFTDMIEPYVARKTNFDAPLPASLHGAFHIIFNHWLSTKDAAPQTVGVPDGWKLAPIDSKHIDLFSPAFNLCSEFGQEFVQANEAFARAVYREFVAAAPAMPEGKTPSPKSESSDHE